MSAPLPGMTNQRIADVLDRVAELLEEQGAEVHRVRSWRHGAQAVAAFPEDLGEVFRGRGRAGLEEVPYVGAHLSSVIIELIRTGRCAALDRLLGDVSPADRFARLPGVGHELGERIHQELGIETLEELENAAHDGSLLKVPGFGPRRVAAVREILRARLSNRHPRTLSDEPSELPPVALLLQIDREYRRRAAAGELKKIAPRRFNPTGDAWLPMMHEARDGWIFTALYSNTELAHRVHRTRDWVILYYHQPDRDERRATVVTETMGPLRGRRVVRGRESECAVHYRILAAA